MAAFILKTILILSALLFQQFSMASSARSFSNLQKARGFSLNLVHRDSPHSPLYDHSSTPLQRVNQAAERSISRSLYFSSVLSKSNGIWSPAKPGPGDYLMKLTLGNPPVSYWAILDTGSDLIWTQCLPCDGCYKQSDPLFDPSKSSTYKNLDCSNKFCDALPEGHGSCDYENHCQYYYAYGDGSNTQGTLAMETLSFDSNDRRTVKFPAIAFGCGHKDGGLIGKFGTPGLVGLGSGPLSLVSQLGSSIGNKFSYCLVPANDKNSTGSLKFGDSADFSGAGKVQQTPMSIRNEGTFYELTLNDISVGGTKLNIQFNGNIKPPKKVGSDGVQIIIDSGTTLTFLTSDIYEPFASALVKATKYKQVQSPPEASILELCFGVDDSGEGLPEVIFHFDGGADWKLRPQNVFIGVDNGVICSAIIRPPEQISKSLLGNISQQDFHVEYDLENGVLSFVPTDCSKD